VAELLTLLNALRAIAKGDYLTGLKSPGCANERIGLIIFGVGGVWGTGGEILNPRVLATVL
jgi:hypothetical protein